MMSNLHGRLSKEDSVGGDDDEDFEEDIDALNDETFGCDLGDLNSQDWEKEHEKLVSNTSDLSSKTTNNAKHERSTEFIDSGPVVDSQNFNHFFFNNKFPINFANNSDKNIFNDDPTEDFLKHNISILNFDDESEDEESRSFYNFIDSVKPTDNQILALKENSSKIITAAKNIDLNSLKPPSPSILPFDQPFMSSVWCPPSPPEFVASSLSPIQNKSETKEIESNYSNGYSQVISNENSVQNSIKSSGVIRLEDLEADLLKKLSSSSPTHQFHLQPQARLSVLQSNLNNVSGLEQNNYQKNAPFTMPFSSSNSPGSYREKFVPPPPGLGPAAANTNVSTSNKQQFPISFTPILHNVRSDGSVVQWPPQNNISSGSNKNAYLLSSSPFMNKPVGLNSLTAMDPRVRQEQRRIIDKIITPAQAQRRYFSNQMKQQNFNRDKFAGFMTQKEKDWLVKIFRLQCKVNDPYVEDYYEVNYDLKNIAKQNQIEKSGGLDDNMELGASSENRASLLVLSELAKVEETKPRYIQFDNALGKIQVLNAKCPRKALELEETNFVFENFKLDLHNQCLLKIERLYEYLLQIEDEDKRMPILPDAPIKLQHQENRTRLCNQLYDGLTSLLENHKKNEPQNFQLINRQMPTLKRINITMDPLLLKINKGLTLIVRSLELLENETHRVVVFCSILRKEIFNRIVQMELDNRINLMNLVIKVLTRIKMAQNLIYIAAHLDDGDIFKQKKYGFRLLWTLFQQYELSEDKLLFFYFWKLFVQTLEKNLVDTSESHKICVHHLDYLNQL